MICKTTGFEGPGQIVESLHSNGLPLLRSGELNLSPGSDLEDSYCPAPAIPRKTPPMPVLNQIPLPWLTLENSSLPQPIGRTPMEEL